MIIETISTLVQVLILTFIPFLVYIIQFKSFKGFFEYIGLKKANRKANFLSIIVCILYAIPIIVLILVYDDFKELLFGSNSITGKLRQMEFNTQTMYILLITAIFKTSFAEEILFRGFFAKRLIASLGFQKGNILQAFIFGAIHLVGLVFISNNIVLLILVFMLPFIMAYIVVYLNEKVGNGSIIPGWITHGLSNSISFIIVGFLL